MGYRFKPSLFILCDFHYLGINIYREKKLVALISGHTSHISAVTVLILSCPSIASYHPYIKVSIKLGYYIGKLLFYCSCIIFLLFVFLVTKIHHLCFLAAMPFLTDLLRLFIQHIINPLNGTLPLDHLQKGRCLFLDICIPCVPSTFNLHSMLFVSFCNTYNNGHP
jgi:hypothetical protein